MPYGDDVRRAREELGEVLGELKAGLDVVLADARQLDERDHAPVAAGSDVTPEVGGALWELLRKMPGVIGDSLSGDRERVERARDMLAGLDTWLREAGVELDGALTRYADRLAGLRGGATGSGPGRGDRPRRGR